MNEVNIPTLAKEASQLSFAEFLRHELRRNMFKNGETAKPFQI